MGDVVTRGNALTIPSGTTPAPETTGVAATGPLRLGDLFDPRCPTRQLLDRLGGKWTSMAIKVLDDGRPGEIRFAELADRRRWSRVGPRG